MNQYIYANKQYILFIFGLLIKVYTIFVHSPGMISNFFAPFVNQFLSHPTHNPYDYFYHIGCLDIFPYGSLMLVSLGWLQGVWYAVSRSLSSTIPIMLSLLLFDIMLCFSLLKKLKGCVTLVLILYWISPLIYYITYIYGQLDVIPTLFLMLGFYFLDNRLGLVSLLLGISVAIKANNLLIIPFFLIYLYRNSLSLSSVIKYLFYIILPYFVFNGVLIFSEGFRNIVIFNSVQSQLLNVFVSFGTVSVYIVPILYSLLLYKFLTFPYIVKDLFILFSTITFSFIMLFLPPQPGWYYWIVPLLVYSILRYDHALMFLYCLWSVGLTVFFIIPNNIIYTVVFFIQIVVSIRIYFRVINRYVSSKILYHPYFVGISGDSGAGKTQLAQSISNFFGRNFSLVLCGDDLHKWERGHENWKIFTHLNPVAQNLYNNVKDFMNLKQGKKISRTCYDHDTGKFVTINNITAKNIVVHEGLHSLYLPQERDLYDLKIFIDPQKELYHQWKINRDTVKRGYSSEAVAESITKRLLDKQKYIDAQRQHANIIISYYTAKKRINNLGVKLISDMMLDLEPLIEKINKLPKIYVSVRIEEFRQVLDIQLDEDITAEMWGLILLELCPQIENYPFTNKLNKNNYEGLVLIFVLYNIFSQRSASGG